MNNIIDVQPAAPLAEDAHDIAARAWKSARTRHAATREAVALCLDGPAPVAPVTHTEQPAIESPVTESESVSEAYATLVRRALLLSDSLQRHALLRIAETGLVLDDIDRAVATRMRSNPKDT